MRGVSRFVSDDALEVTASNPSLRVVLLEEGDEALFEGLLGHTLWHLEHFSHGPTARIGVGPCFGQRMSAFVSSLLMVVRRFIALLFGKATLGHILDCKSNNICLADLAPLRKASKHCALVLIKTHDERYRLLCFLEHALIVAQPRLRDVGGYPQLRR